VIWGSVFDRECTARDGGAISDTPIDKVTRGAVTLRVEGEGQGGVKGVGTPTYTGLRQA